MVYVYRKHGLNQGKTNITEYDIHTNNRLDENGDGTATFILKNSVGYRNKLECIITQIHLGLNFYSKSSITKTYGNNTSNIMD